jgi:2-oxoglutarate/2-oxoacid ferredoxin oxidoreductase subunit beta
VSPTPFGIFRSIDRPEYASSVATQVAMAGQKKGPGDLASLLRSNGTWHVD